MLRWQTATSLSIGFVWWWNRRQTESLWSIQKAELPWSNTQIEKMFGYGRAELIGRPVEILIPDRFSSHHSMLRNSFFKQPETRPMGAGRDLYGRRKNGTEFPVEIGLNAIDNTSGQRTMTSYLQPSSTSPRARRRKSTCGS